MKSYKQNESVNTIFSFVTSHVMVSTSTRHVLKPRKILFYLIQARTRVFLKEIHILKNIYRKNCYRNILVKIEWDRDIRLQFWPPQKIFIWIFFRFGFLLRQRYNAYLRTFYSEPFTTLVWVCLFIIVFISSLEFYLLSYWDAIQFGGESSFVHELLFAFSACCQQSK